MQRNGKTTRKRVSTMRRRRPFRMHLGKQEEKLIFILENLRTNPEKLFML